MFSTKNLEDHARELLILLKLDDMAKKKMPRAPSKEVLDELQQLAMDEFAAYQGRTAKYRD